MSLIQCIQTWYQDSIKWIDIVPFLAISISIIALIISVKFSNKNIHLSIQHALMKIVSDKSRDCNKVWINEPETEKNDNSPHFLVVTELIITTEIVNKSFDLFSKNYRAIRDYEEYYYYIFWKQLTPDIRGWVKKTCNEKGNLENMGNDIYTNQIKTLSDTFKQYFE
jgi:hypothetical protein